MQRGVMIFVCISMTVLAVIVALCCLMLIPEDFTRRLGHCLKVEPICSMTYLQIAVHGGIHKMVQGLIVTKWKGLIVTKQAPQSSKNCSNNNHSAKQLKLSARYRVMLPTTSESSYAGSLIHLPMVNFVPTATNNLVHECRKEAGHAWHRP